MLKILKIGFNLMVVALLGAIILAFSNNITAPLTKKVEEETKARARKAVINADEFIQIDPEGRFFKAIKDGKLLGYVITALAKNGYAGSFGVMVGVSPTLKVVKIKILNQRETPGLGTKIEEDWFLSQYEGKGVENLVVIKEETADKIQAITGATISSKAVTDGVKEGIEELKKKLTCLEKN
ncbi:FMN-binding protein [bacterium]|nr:FMN-binding protein [bacterium]